MRRRSRRAPNLSESTGKIGQELPSNQPAPLVPFYPDEPGAPQPARPSAPRPAATPEPQRRAPDARTTPPERSAPSERPPRTDRSPRPESRPAWNDPANSGRLEVETQPEIPSVPPPEVQPADRSQ